MCDLLKNKFNDLLENTYACRVIRQILLLKVFCLEALWGTLGSKQGCDHLSVGLPPEVHRESNADLSRFWQGLCWKSLGTVPTPFETQLPVQTSELTVARN